MKYTLLIDESCGVMKTQIFDTDNKELLDCTGYRKCKISTYASYCLSVILFGIPWLIIFLKPVWKIRFTYKKCGFEDAGCVILEDNKTGHKYVIPLKIIFVDSQSEILCQLLPQDIEIKKKNCKFKNVSNDISTYLEADDFETGSFKFIYFDFHFSRFYWNPHAQNFQRLEGIDKKLLCYQIVEDYSHGLIPQERVQRSHIFGPNEIEIEIKSYFTLFFEEIVSPFYAFQIFSVVLWLCDHYYYYASCIILITTISIAVSLYETKKQSVTIRNMVMKGSSTDIDVIYNENSTKDEAKRDIVKTVHNVSLVPGDLISLYSRGMIMPCDAVLVSGTCIVNESVLTGESVPVIKTSVGNQGCDNELFDSLVHKKHTIYAGTTILLAKPSAACHSEENFNKVYDEKAVSRHCALAVVVKTGFSTTKGELVRSILHPNPLGFEFYKDSLKFVCVLACLAGMGMIYSAYILYLRKATISKLIMRTLDVVTIVVPPSLPAAMTVGTVYSQNRLKKSSIFCISPPRINVCGKIDLACFDKTGTLTEDGLDFYGVLPNDTRRIKFGQIIKDPHSQIILNRDGPKNKTDESPERKFQAGDIQSNDNLDNSRLLYSMACCHSLTLIDGEVCGDPLELKMFQSTKWVLEEPNPLLSPDSSLLPTIVKSSSSQTQDETASNQDLISGLPSSVEIGIIKHFTFSSILQCMSVISKTLTCKHFDLFTKGAPEKILSLCQPETVPDNYLDVLKTYTMKGFRVIAMAHKKLDKKLTWHHAQKTKREDLEKDLTFLGFLIMKNALKPNTTQVIRELLSASIRPVMITGDNMLTAISVAHECAMIPYGAVIICINVKLNTPPFNPKPYKSENNETNTSTDDYKIILNGDQEVKHLKFDDDPSLEYTVEYEILEKINKPSPVKNLIDCHEFDDEIDIEMNNPLPVNANPTQQLYPNLEERVTLLNKNYSTANHIVKSGRNKIELNFENNKFHKFSSKEANTFSNPNFDDYYFAMTGRSYGLLAEHYNELLHKIMTKASVFARMSPDNKTSLVESYKQLGYVVSMCGDGANDCGALKSSDAGISLSDAESSVASPFTSKNQNIDCVLKIIKEGRCSLATSFGVFKFMALYSMIQFASVLILYTEGYNLSDTQFLYIDLGIITTLAIFMGRTKPFDKLVKEKPPSCLMTFPNLLSIFCQLTIQIAFQTSAIIYLKHQTWYNKVKHATDNLYENNETINWDTTVVFWISCFQYLFMAIVFSRGKPFRKPIYSNYLFLLTIIAILVFNSLFIVNPNGYFENFFSLISSKKSMHMTFRFIIISFVIANFLLSITVEYIISHLTMKFHTFSRLFKPSMPPYVKIEKELKTHGYEWMKLSPSSQTPKPP
ncbi:polyamine-transporting ATPase 13A3-like isoform X2 [Gordionus sp. m RMFG-2023]|uniref:polyamine-transporting ATPase 13A3-like isoform X2 n=1 Tax=Gordionus sp. m RMFG-2023 TaxID=3053472 RepID=UPI0031FBCE3B